MKKIGLIVVSLFCSITLFAQDLIVTTDRDSINCKVIKVDQDNIFYNIDGRSSVISLVKVKTCLYNYYKQQLPVPDPVQIEEENDSEMKKDEPGNYKRFRFGLNGGLGYRTYSIGDGLSTEISNYYKKLKLGYHFEGDASFFFSANKAFGIKGSLYRSSNLVENVWQIENNGSVSTGDYSDDITILYAGPSFTNRLNNPRSVNSFYFTASIGFMHYINNCQRITDYTIKGSAMGFTIDLGYDWALSDRISLGIQASLVNGSLSKITQTDSAGLVSTYYWNEGLTRIDLGAGLRF